MFSLKHSPNFSPESINSKSCGDMIRGWRVAGGYLPGSNPPLDTNVYKVRVCRCLWYCNRRTLHQTGA